MVIWHAHYSQWVFVCAACNSDWTGSLWSTCRSRYIPIYIRVLPDVSMLPWTCQYDNRDRALRQLMDTVNDRERCGLFRYHSYNIAGHCMLIAGMWIWRGTCFWYRLGSHTQIQLSTNAMLSISTSLSCDPISGVLLECENWTSRVCGPCLNMWGCISRRLGFSNCCYFSLTHRICTR